VYCLGFHDPRKKETTEMGMYCINHSRTWDLQPVPANMRPNPPEMVIEMFENELKPGTNSIAKSLNLYFWYSF